MTINKINRILICSVLTGSLMLSGVYFPIVNFTPAFLVLLIVLSILTAIPIIFHKRFSISSAEKGFYGAEIGLCFTVYISYIVNGEVFSDRYLLIVMSFLFSVACIISIENHKDIAFYLYFYIIITAISSIVEIGQVFGVQACYKIWDLVQEGEALEHFSAGNRYIGLASNVINFGYQITVAYTITLFIEFKKWKSLKPILLVMFVLSALTSQTRSSMIWMAGITGLLIISRKKGKHRWLKVIISSIIICSIGFLIVSGKLMDYLGSTRILSASETTGTQARIPMFLTAINHAIHYPLGMGTYSVQSDLIVNASGKVYFAVLNNSAHNIIGNCLAGYGFITLLLLTVLYFYAYKSYKRSQKQGVSKAKKNVKIAYYCVMALLFSSMLHNKYVLNGDFSAWLFLSICIAASKNSYERSLCFNE